LVRGLIIALSTLTPVFLIVAALLGAVSPQSATIGSWSYLSEGERAALSWLRNRPEAVVLCSPQTGSFIPAWSSQRVVYGHPFETVRAERRREQVEAYWSGEMTSLEQAAFLREHGVRYLFIGPRERAIGGQAGERTRVGDLAFERDDTRIYEVSER
jgi:uncharacterized membrane protein